MAAAGLAITMMVGSVAFGPASSAGANAGVDSESNSGCQVVTADPTHRSLSGDRAAVERLYRALFLRRPEPEGLDYWTKVLESGRADLAGVAERFASSPEFTRRYGAVGDRQFVELLYCNVVGRVNGGTGASYWQAQLSQGLSRGEVVLYFSQSEEFIRKSSPEPVPTEVKSKQKPSTTTPTTAAPQTTSPSTTSTTTTPSTTAPSTTSSTTTPEPDPDTGTATPTLVWSDDFNSFDSDVWRKEHSTYGDGNNELQCYRPANVNVHNGALVLTAKRETYTCPNGSTREVTSGMVRGKVNFDYGQRIEFRVKVNPNNPDDQRGLWPALWASSWNGGGWPNGGEFDWLEYVGKEPTKSHFTIHYAKPDGGKDKMPKAVEMGERFSDQWRTIAFDWTDDLVWYLDGVEVQRITAADVDANNNPFLESANAVTQIKLNFALGGSWGGALGPDTIDADGNTTFVIDYVRIYDLD